MSRVFVISDTHFGHTNILGFTSRGKLYRTIEAHDEAIIENWNAEVTNRDVVYHLGDVCWYGPVAARVLPLLNGKRKYLIAGNHDVPKWVTPYFDAIGGAKDMGKRGCLLTHVPIHPQEFYRWEFNIHGHLHDGYVKDEKGNRDDRYICASCEHINMRPVELDALIEHRRAVTHNQHKGE